jgi:thiamine kinase-like enzyme
VKSASSGFVVKQGTNSETIKSVNNEAEACRLLTRTNPVVPVPEVLSFADGRLVSEYVPGETLSESINRDRAVHAERAGDVAAILAALHRTEVDQLSVAEARPSPVFFLATPPLTAFQFHSQGSHQLTRLVQSDPALMAGLQLLHSRWRLSHVIHNDVRPENLIVRPDSGLVVIDWELAGLGEPLWDLGGLVAEHLVAFLEDGDTWTRASDQRAAASADSLGRLHRTAHRILEVYQAHAAMNVHPVELVQWVAARLVLTAMERCTAASAVPASCRHLLQLAANLFRRPEAGARIFLGANPL